MLHRRDKDGLIVISQPAHAWVSGQLARHWGNDRFGRLTPAEEVCLAAEQHDIGFLQWEKSPALNVETGLPQTFMEMPTGAHLNIWSQGVRDMMRYGRYPALLVSMHFTFLCQQHPVADSPEEMQLMQNFLDDQEAFQSAIRTSLLNDFYYAPFSTEYLIQRNRQLVSLWDRLSLLLCMGFTEEQSVEHVPSLDSETQLRLKLIASDPPQVGISPWPFCTDSVRVICEGRRLLKTFQQETELHQALIAASPVALQIDLIPL